MIQFLTMSDLITIVNTNDEVIGAKERDLLLPDDIYRVTALWLVNQKGEVLLQKRSENKKKHPGLYCPSVAGTVQEGETYEQNIFKESKEELDLDLKQILPLRKYYSQSDTGPHFTQYFVYQLDKQNDLEAGKIQYDSEEMSGIFWFSFAQLEQMLDAHESQFIPNIRSKLADLQAFLKSTSNNS